MSFLCDPREKGPSASGEFLLKEVSMGRTEAKEGKVLYIQMTQVAQGGTQAWSHTVRWEPLSRSIRAQGGLSGSPVIRRVPDLRLRPKYPQGSKLVL